MHSAARDSRTGLDRAGYVSHPDHEDLCLGAEPRCLYHCAILDGSSNITLASDLIHNIRIRPYHSTAGAIGVGQKLFQKRDNRPITRLKGLKYWPNQSSATKAYQLPRRGKDKEA